ncbi:hypothetical protein PMIN03_002006 [Paraphaeosphaeria minitans]
MAQRGRMRDSYLTLAPTSGAPTITDSIRPSDAFSPDLTTNLLARIAAVPTYKQHLKLNSCSFHTST